MKGTVQAHEELTFLLSHWMGVTVIYFYQLRSCTSLFLKVIFLYVYVCGKKYVN